MTLASGALLSVCLISAAAHAAADPALARCQPDSALTGAQSEAQARRDSARRQANQDAQAYFAWERQTSREFEQELNRRARGLFQALGPAPVWFNGSADELARVALITRHGREALIRLSPEAQAELRLSELDPAAADRAERDALLALSEALRERFADAFESSRILEATAARRLRLSALFTAFPVEAPDPFEGLVTVERWLEPDGRALFAALLSSAGAAQMAQRAWEDLCGSSRREWIAYGDFHPFDQRSVADRSPLALLARFRHVAQRSRELNAQH